MAKKGTIKQTEIQTVILSKSRFKTSATAKKWIKDHNFKVSHEGKGPDETSTSYRFRQRDPGDFQAGSFRTISLDRGVSAVIGRPKKKATTKADDLVDLIEVLVTDA